MRGIFSFVSAAAIALVSMSAAAQCAPGIPSAGNPGCIPPNQENSPYYPGDPSPDADAGPAPIWEYHWGAIAMDRQSGSGGVAVDALSKQKAQEIALADCQANGGKNCAILYEYYNQCVALAQTRGGGNMGMARDDTKSLAESAAMTRCHEATCEIVYSACSLPVRMN